MLNDVGCVCVGGGIMFFRTKRTCMDIYTVYGTMRDNLPILCFKASHGTFIITLLFSRVFCRSFGVDSTTSINIVNVGL